MAQTGGGFRRDDRRRKDAGGAPKRVGERGSRPSDAAKRPERGSRPSDAAKRPERGSRPSDPAKRRGDAAKRATSGGERFGRAEDRAKRGAARVDEPALPTHIDVTQLDRSVRAELRTLSKPNAEAVAGHLVAAGLCLDDDPRRALAHARAARSRASRVGAVREAVGIAAYHAGEWAEAITELRTARRITGDARYLPMLADCERALGRPAQAVRALSDPGVGRMDPQSRAELLIVVAGARRDMGQLDAALAVLARGGLDRDHPRPGAVRLWYAYADALEEAGRRQEAATWFAASAALDPEGETDAVDRAAALL